MRKLIIVLFFGVCIAGFGQEGLNKFSDPVIREIHDLADQRDILGLMTFLRDTNLNYRGETLMCLGSCWEQSPMGGSVSLADSIIVAMGSHIDGIRMAGAFALGQSYDSLNAPKLIQLIEKEEKPLVRGMMYDALGKCGNLEDLNWLAEREMDFQESEGQAMGIMRFGMRGISSDAGNTRMVAICADGSSVVGLGYASYHLARYASTEWLQANPVIIRQLFDNERNSIVRSQLIKAVIRAEDEEAWSLVEHILKSDEDYRVKVNIMTSIKLIPWNKVGPLIYKYAIGEDPGLAIAAAEAIQKNAVYTDLTIHLKSIDQAKNWRSRAILLDKGLELVKGKKALTKKLEKQLFEYFAIARHASEKGWLLKGLVHDLNQFSVLEDEIRKANAPVITTNALETLISMMKSDEYEKFKEDQAKEGLDIDQKFLDILKQAIISEDITSVSIAALALADPGLNFKSKIQDLDFLKSTLDNMQAPEKVEARNALVYALSYFMDKKAPPMAAPGYNHPIDWERVQAIDPEQLVAFVTSKGEVIVKLNLNWCPGTVSAFLELAEGGFYNGGIIHRVVPNFVAQDGCPRGDGWGGPEFTIRSEFTPAPFVEGTLGMASAGQDTEGSQWYFTHSPTPHLDGKYTNFGYVVAGMDVVHKLEIGDVIERIEMISEEN